MKRKKRVVLKKPIAPKGGGCLCCPQPTQHLSLSRRIAVGFGFAALTRDGEVVWAERGHEYDKCLSVRNAERRAQRDPDHDWRIVLDGPMHGETYQRHGPSKWVCIASNHGFA